MGGAPFECPQDRLRQAQGERGEGDHKGRPYGVVMGGAPFECPQDRLRQAQGERGEGDHKGRPYGGRATPLDSGYTRNDGLGKRRQISTTYRRRQ